MRTSILKLTFLIMIKVIYSFWYDISINIIYYITMIHNIYIFSFSENQNFYIKIGIYYNDQSTIYIYIYIYTYIYIYSHLVRIEIKIDIHYNDQRSIWGAFNKFPDFFCTGI